MIFNVLCADKLLFLISYLERIRIRQMEGREKIQLILSNKNFCSQSEIWKNLGTNKFYSTRFRFRFVCNISGELAALIASVKKQ